MLKEFVSRVLNESTFDHGANWQPGDRKLIDDIREIYKLEYMLFELEKAKDEIDRRQGRTPGLAMTKALAIIPDRLNVLLDNAIKQLGAYIREHHLIDTQSGAHMPGLLDDDKVIKPVVRMIRQFYNGYLGAEEERWDDHINHPDYKLKVRGKTASLRPDRQSIGDGSKIVEQAIIEGMFEHIGIMPSAELHPDTPFATFKFYSKYDELAAWMKKYLHRDEVVQLARRAHERNKRMFQTRIKLTKKLRAMAEKVRVCGSLNLKQKLVLFHQLLTFEHERGRLYGTGDDENDSYDRLTTSELDELSAGPDPAWDREIERLVRLTSEARQR